MGKKEKNRWYKNWFNSPYYHKLYKHRDKSEASTFIANITKQLNLPQQAKVLDLACGKGRFSIELAKQGYDVTGLDLAEESIAIAKQHETENLCFRQGDMREPIANNEFNAVFNLFTSFGYFDDKAEDEKVFKAVYQQLKPNGYFVFDFINTQQAINSLVASEQKTVDGVAFNISREYDGKHIIKTISFSANGKTHSYQEKVAAYNYPTLSSMLKNNGFKEEAVYGNYKLASFSEKESKRLIILLKKK